MFCCFVNEQDMHRLRFFRLIINIDTGCVNVTTISWPMLLRCASIDNQINSHLRSGNGYTIYYINNIRYFFVTNLFFSFSLFLSLSVFIKTESLFVYRLKCFSIINTECLHKQNMRSHIKVQ